MKLAHESIGSGSPVVVLHGLYASAASWRRVARALAARHRVISVDLRNHGASPASQAMGYAEMADDVLELLDREGLDAVSLVGHCIGGKVAMALALRAPERVRRLCVIEIAPVTFVDQWMQQLRAMRRGLAVNGGGAALSAWREATAGSLLQRYTLPPAAVDTAYFDWRSHLASIGPWLPELREFPAELQGLTSAVELHAIIGSSATLVRPADASAFQPMFPRTRVQVIEGASHWVHVCRPGALVMRLRHLLGARAAHAEFA